MIDCLMLNNQPAVTFQCGTLVYLWPLSRGVKSTWKPYLSKSIDTLQWKLLHYKLQVTNSKTTWVKVLKYLILTVSILLILNISSTMC